MSDQASGTSLHRGSASRGGTVVRAGFIPLLDAAVLLAAAEVGFAAREGIHLEMVKDVTWSNIRDRLAFRQFDVAHMLSPMPIASQLGIGSNPYPVITPMSLGLGGNAITLSTGLYERMQESAVPADGEGPVAEAQRLRRVVEARKAAGGPPLVFAVVYPFSSHNYEFRFWMASAGIDPDRDVQMTVVPPPLMADAMLSGAIDGFCVNAPWNMIAIEAGAGRLVVVKADLWPSSPEKVLGLRPDWAAAHPETVSRLIVALDAAAQWCDEPANRDDLSRIMAEPRYVGAPLDVIRRVVEGQLVLDGSGRRREIPGYMTFHRHAATFPWKSHALWVYSQMVRWGQVAYDPSLARAAASAYRPDLYRLALGGSGMKIPLADMKIEGAFEAPTWIEAEAGPLEMQPDRFFDGPVFDPNDIEAYIAAFPTRAKAIPFRGIDGD